LAKKKKKKKKDKGEMALKKKGKPNGSWNNAKRGSLKNRFQERVGKAA